MPWNPETYYNIDNEQRKDERDKKLQKSKNLKKKYPALKNAYDHYQNIKQMCESKEKKED